MMRATLAWLALCAAVPSFAVDSGDIFVTSLRGDVQVTVNGAVRAVRAGGVLELPASVRTGHDGSIELRQGATTLNVGPDTLLNFPALERRGAPVDVIQQPRGNVFYDIGKRAGRKLRVETPYLVGVVKGTQFNVSARDEATTISLFEGLLEVRASDDSDVVDLKAGEIAARRRGDKSISVIRMDASKTAAGASRGQNDGGGGGDGAGNGGSNAPEAPRGAGSGSLVDSVIGTVGQVSNGGSVSASVGTDVRAPGVAVGADAAVSSSGGDTSVSSSASASVASSADVSTGVTVNAGANGVGADVSAVTNVTAGPVSADVSTSTNVDVGSSGVVADAGASVNVAAGPVAVDTSAAASVDVSGTGMSTDVTTSTNVDAGPVTTAVDTGAAVDLGTSGVSTAVDTGVSLGVVDAPVEVSAGVSTGVDVSTGTVDLGVNVAGADLDLGVDLSLGGSEPATDTGSSTTDTATDTGNTGTTDVGGLLDSLLRRPGRK